MLAIGIDMGGTKIEGAVINDKGKIHASYRVPTEAEKGGKHILNNIAKVVHELKAKKNYKVEGIGISLPGFVDGTGKLVFAGGTLICLQNMNLKKELKKRTRLPIFLANDANCFALAEAVYGAGKKYKMVVGVIWGTGVGGGIVVNKRIYTGAFGGAGEFGHVVIDPTVKKGKRCGCGQFACLEMLTSGKNISRRYREAGGKIPNANPRQIYDSKEGVAKKVMISTIHHLGLGLSILVNILNPDIIVLGGGVSLLPNRVYNQLEGEVRKYALPILYKKLRITRHQISDAAGILGAAAMVFNH